MASYISVRAYAERPGHGISTALQGTSAVRQAHCVMPGSSVKFPLHLPNATSCPADAPALQ